MVASYGAILILLTVFILWIKSASIVNTGSIESASVQMDGTGEAIRLLERDLPLTISNLTSFRSWGTSQSNLDDAAEILQRSPELYTHHNFKEFLVKSASLEKSDRSTVVKVVSSSLLQNDVRLIITYPDGITILAGKYSEPSYVNLNQNQIKIKIPLSDHSFIEYFVVEKTTDINAEKILFEETL